MRGRPAPRRAPDYTNAALIMGFMNLIWIFVLLWAAFGFWTVLAAGIGLNTLITRLEDRLERQ
ncbi:MAG: hypothetical protein AAGG09_06215 [Pseudomonadota bacterium]